MPFRTLILNNFWLKLFSLFFATLIYFAIDTKSPRALFGSRLPALEVRCPVSVMVPPGSHATFTLKPGSVLVKVRGEEAVLKKLTPESIPAFIRLADVPKPVGLFRVEVSIPRDVTLEEVMPEQVSVESSASTAP